MAAKRGANIGAGPKVTPPPGRGQGARLLVKAVAISQKVWRRSRHGVPSTKVAPSPDAEERATKRGRCGTSRSKTDCAVLRQRVGELNACNRTIEQGNRGVDFAGHQAAHCLPTRSPPRDPCLSTGPEYRPSRRGCRLVSDKGDPFLLFDLDGFALTIAHRLRPSARPLRRT
jgi:hypothetical protein